MQHDACVDGDKAVVYRAWYEAKNSALLARKYQIAAQFRIQPTSLDDVELNLVNIDLGLQLGDSLAARQLARLRHSITSVAVGDGLTRQIVARLGILAEPNAGPWLRYLAGWGPLPPSEKTTTWLQRYLQLRRALGGTRDIQALLHTPVPKNTDPSLHREWLRMLAERAMDLRQYSVAAIGWERLAQVTLPGSRTYYAQLARLAHFLSNFTVSH